MAILSTTALPCWQYGKIKKQLQQSIRRFQLWIATSVWAGNWNTERWRHWWRHKTGNLAKATPKIDGIGQSSTTRSRTWLFATAKLSKPIQITSTTKASCHSSTQPHGYAILTCTINSWPNDNLTRTTASQSPAKRTIFINIVERQTKKDWWGHHNRLWRQFKRRIPNRIKPSCQLSKLVQWRRLSLSHEFAAVPDTIHRTSKTSNPDENSKTDLQRTLQRWYRRLIKLDLYTLNIYILDAKTNDCHWLRLSFSDFLCSRFWNNNQ